MPEASSTHVTDFFPNPVQKGFIESRAKADLMASRMGEGKSTALAWGAYSHTKQNPGAKWFLARDTWENLRATTMKTFFEWFPPGIYGTFHHTHKEWTWASGIAEGTVEFIGMDDPADANKLLSRDFAGGGFDEPAPAVGSAGIDEMIFDVTFGRLRQPDMKWYAVKLATNNPDESHWTYQRFVSPGDPEFRLWQPAEPENVHNLPPGYYADLRRRWAHRPDLIRRFVDGEFGFQSIGKAVTPQWSDKAHLARGLIPVPRVPLTLLWDWGHTPTCVVTQKTPMGSWNVLDSLVGDDVGAQELIEDAVAPLLRQKYRGYEIHNIGDPAGEFREQGSIKSSPVLVVKKLIGGSWRPGPVKPEHRIEPLRAVLARMVGGRAVVQVDKDNAAEVWHALRGGWHFHISRQGIVSEQAVKDIASHPGDAMSYGAAILFPMDKFYKGAPTPKVSQGQWFGGKGPQPLIGFEKPGMILPKHGQVFKG